MLYVGSYCGSLRGAWRTTGFKNSDINACLSSNCLRDFLEIKCVLMIEGDMFDWMLVWLEIPGMS